MNTTPMRRVKNKHFILKELICVRLNLLFFVSTGAKRMIGIQKSMKKYSMTVYGINSPKRGEKKIIARPIPYDRTVHIVGVEACIPPQKERRGMKVNKNNKLTQTRFVNIPKNKSNITKRHLLRIILIQYS